MLKVPDFTKSEIDFIKENANFTAQETMLFDLRNEEHCLEECAEIMNISISTAKRLNKKVKAKIVRVI